VGGSLPAVTESRLYSPRGFLRKLFEPIQQNQIIVAAQAYTEPSKRQCPANVLAHFQQKGSDSLYELRVLAHQNGLLRQSYPDQECRF